MTVSVGQTIATLRARAERIRAAHATQAATLRERLATAIATLLPSHAKAWLIGSLAWGGFGERSDVDVVVRGLTPQAATRLDLALLRETCLAVFLAAPHRCLSPTASRPRSFAAAALRFSPACASCGVAVAGRRAAGDTRR